MVPFAFHIVSGSFSTFVAEVGAQQQGMPPVDFLHSTGIYWHAALSDGGGRCLSSCRLPLDRPRDSGPTDGPRGAKD